MTADEIIKALGGEGTRAVCPSCQQERKHAEENSSLSIETSPSGRVLVHCFWGCSQKEVLDALRVRGLWGPPSRASILRQKDIDNQLEIAKIVRWAHNIVAMAEFETLIGNETTDPYDRADLQKAQGIVAAYPDWRSVEHLRDSPSQVIPHYFLNDLVAAEAARDGVELYEDSEQYGIRATDKPGITSAW